MRYFLLRNETRSAQSHFRAANNRGLQGQGVKKTYFSRVALARSSPLLGISYHRTDARTIDLASCFYLDSVLDTMQYLVIKGLDYLAGNKGRTRRTTG